MADIASARTASYSIGAVIKTTLLLAWRSLGAILLISLGFEFLVTLIDRPSDNFTIGFNFHFDLFSVGSARRAAARLLGYAFITAPITYLTLHDLTSYKPNIGDIIEGGFRRIVHVAVGAVGFAIAVLMPVLVGGLAAGFLGLPSGLTSVVALVSGLPVVAALFVLMPSLVVENVGFFGSFGRSVELTKGRRWSVLAILLIGCIFNVLFGIVFVLLVAAFVTISPLIWVGIYIPLILFDASYWVVWAIVPAVTFYYLRRDKDGLPPEQTAVVFD